jgi:hypothetical protein
MTKILMLFFAFIMMLSILQDQKKPLDPDAYNGWKSIRSPVISDDGKYAETRVTKKNKIREELMPKNNLGIRVLQESKEPKIDM